MAAARLVLWLQLWNDPRRMDAVARYRDASERNDIDSLLETLTDDAELVSPISALPLGAGGHATASSAR